MILRVDNLQAKLPAIMRKGSSAALQELPGGEHGGSSMPGDSLLQGFASRSINRLRPCYSLDAAHTAKGDGGGMSEGGKIHALPRDHRPEEAPKIASKPNRNSH